MGTGEEKPIDFSWIVFIGMNRLGFPYRQMMHMYFDTKRGMYVLQEEDDISSLSVL